jgi:phosphopantetheinyl transferase
MPLVYQQNINSVTEIGVWHITEAESFFLEQVPLQRNITHWHKRLQHLAGRILLKTLVPDFPVSLIQVADTKKPFLENEPYHFSISHCGDYAAAIVSTGYRVGVDVELITNKATALVPKFLSTAEKDLWLSDHADAMATLCWSAKESLFKWYSLGGVDFKKDMRVIKITGTEEQGTMDMLFRENTALQLQYLHFNGYYLTWLDTPQ